MTPIIFTHPEYRTLAFKRSGTKYLNHFDKQIRGKIIREYEDLPFDRDSLVVPSSVHFTPHPYIPAPPPITLHDVARGVLRIQFIDFGDPDHLALIRLDGLVLMKLLPILARREHHTEIRLPNTIIDTRAITMKALDLQDQLGFLDQYLPLAGLTRPPLRTYDEIVELATSAPLPA